MAGWWWGRGLWQQSCDRRLRSKWRYKEARDKIFSMFHIHLVDKAMYWAGALMTHSLTWSPPLNTGDQASTHGPWRPFSHPNHDWTITASELLCARQSCHLKKKSCLSTDFFFLPYNCTSFLPWNLEKYKVIMGELPATLTLWGFSAVYTRKCIYLIFQYEIFKG